MRNNMFRVPLLLVVVSGLGQAQVASSIRRISKDFTGEVPLIWTIEGSGRLVGASMRLVDDVGAEIIPDQQMTTVKGEGGTWISWTMISPGELFRTLESGRYVADWRLDWEVEGKVRRERTEMGFRVERRGDGWLQQAFSSSTSNSADWSVPTQWIPGTILRIQRKSRSPIQNLRYQIVGDQDEAIRRSWIDLKPDKYGNYLLPAEAAWHPGMLHLWLLSVDGQGVACAQSFDVQFGGVGNISPARSDAQNKSLVMGFSNSQQLQMAPEHSVVADTTTDWLSSLNESAPPGWSGTNRVSTVTVGYVDEERNAVRLWPTDADRPMSIGVSGADGLGKPIYSVNYLLAARGSSATALEAIADQGAKVGTTSFPTGATQLPIGKVPAPVIFSAGKIEDFLGKPLAAGYGWAAAADGVILDAATWTMQPIENSVPPVGIPAILGAKSLKQNLIQKDLDAAGYAGEEPISLDGTRDGFALSVATQDPQGRILLSKGIGALRHDGIVSVLSESPTNYACTFEGALPTWLTRNGGVKQDLISVNPNLVIEPARAILTTYPGSSKFQNLNDAQGDSVTPAQTYEEETSPGTITLNLGRLLPGTTIQAEFLNSGAPLIVDWVLDNGMSYLSTSNSSPLSQPALTSPSQVALRFRNGGQTLPLNATITEADCVRLDNLSITVTPPPVGIEPVETALQQPVVPGFFRTQYGVADLPDGNRYTVTMVTDPDGSAVAELKDLEGRTVFKIVNPTSSYTDYFVDYQGRSFQPSAPTTRGMGAGAQPNTEQRDLVTQYVFDSNGHLRVVIPPKGFTNPWGITLTDAQHDAVLSRSSSSVTSPIPYATHNAFDDSGHLIATFNPDEGLTRFKVDQKGRVHFSQSASQRNRSAWTRTLYDQIFRVRAIGEVIDSTASGADLEAPPIVIDGSQSNFDGSPFSLVGGTSINFYDDYFGADPLSTTTLDSKIRAQLPPAILWDAFADGHLTRTEDLNVVERYFYDQDGRIIIRWVSLKDGAGATRDFAIGIYYDFAGRVKRLVYPAGPTGEPLQVVYTYDDLGRLFAVGTPMDSSYFARYAYHPTGEVRAIIYGPGEGIAAKRILQDPQGWLRTLTIQGR